MDFGAVFFYITYNLFLKCKICEGQAIGKWIFGAIDNHEEYYNIIIFCQFFALFQISDESCQQASLIKYFLNSNVDVGNISHLK